MPSHRCRGRSPWCAALTWPGLALLLAVALGVLGVIAVQAGTATATQADGGAAAPVSPAQDSPVSADEAVTETVTTTIDVPTPVVSTTVTVWPEGDETSTLIVTDTVDFATPVVSTTLPVSPEEDEASTLIVTNTGDHGPGSLRQAIADAQPGDTIDFALSYPATILLTSGELAITKPLIIAGPGPDLLAISGNQIGRVFRVDKPGGTARIAVTISGLEIRDGTADCGGGLWNDETLALADVVVRSNSAASGGGMCAEGGSLALTDVVLIGNQAPGTGYYGWGGGLYLENSSGVLANVAFRGNAANDSGGGIYNQGSSLTLVNAVLTGNQADSGGGIWSSGGTITIRNSILWGNRAMSRDQLAPGNSTPTIAHSDIEGSGGSGAGWDEGLGTDLGGNLDVDPRFAGPVDAYAAPTATGDLRLQGGSPAVDAGDNGTVPPGVTSDLDGNPRIANGTVDMGPYEQQPGLHLYKMANASWATAGQAVTYTITAYNTSGSAMSGGVVSDELPGELAFVGPITLDPPGAGTAGSAPPVLARDLTLDPGQAVAISLPAVVRGGTAPGAVANTAAVTSTQVLTPQLSIHRLRVCAPHLTVTSDADDGPGSLRQAIADACPGGTIDFALTYPATITLTGGELAIRKALTLSGPGPDLLAISGNGAGRVLLIQRPLEGEPMAVTLSGLTVRDGYLWPSTVGAGIWSDADLTLLDVTIRDNYADGSGGGLYQAGERTTLTDVAFLDNACGWWGGGMIGGSDATLTRVIFRGNSSRWGNGGGLHGGGTLQDVTFEGNSADDYGGGMYNRGGSPVLTDVGFIDNSATYGGGMGNEGGGWPVLTDVTFRGNRADTYGGGMYGGGTLTRVVFEGNSAESGGGLNGGGTLLDVTFRGNSAYRGGGLYSSGSLTLTDVTFAGNRAEFGGGGMYTNGNPDLMGVIFQGNSAGYGGGMYSGGSPVLTNVVFRGNQATQEYNWSGGGGLFNLGGSPRLANVILSGNWSPYGGGMTNYAGSPTLINVTISGNSARHGGGINNYDRSAPAIENSIVWGNRAALGGDQIYNDVSTPTITYSDVEDSGGSGAGWDGSLGTDLGGNLDADPRFLNPVQPEAVPTFGGDLHLWWGSPAIDAGDNSLVPAEVTADLDGAPRIVYGRVDLGAYELQPGLHLFKTVTNQTPADPASAGSRAVPGQPITYTLSAANTFTDTAMTGAVVYDALPDGLDYAGPIRLDPPEAGTVGTAPPILVTGLTIQPGQAVIVTLPVALQAGVAPGSTIVNTASITSDQVVTPVLAVHSLPVCTSRATVSSTADGGPGSLRQAIADVCPGGTIDFALSYPATITLASGELVIARPLTIAGPGAELLAVSGNHAGRVFRVRQLGGAGPMAVTISGLTIRDGLAEEGGGLWSDRDLALSDVVFYGNQATGDYGYGGGMYNHGANPALTRVTFRGNSADDYGGGMYNDSGDPALSAVAFLDNAAGSNGGGMYNDSGDPVLSAVEFLDNAAPYYGGGMSNYSGSPVLTGGTFRGNSANWGGGMYNSQGSPALTGVIFADNSADGGGGLYNYSGNPKLAGVTFDGNEAGSGGGMYVNDGSPELEDVSFRENKADSGGGMYSAGDSPALAGGVFEGNSATSYGGGIYSGGNPVLTNVGFEGNTADEGGGMYNAGGSPALTGVALTGNSANAGGGMYNYGGSPSLAGVTLTGNSADAGGGMYDSGGSSGLTGVTFRGNSAADSGGGLHSRNGSPVLTQVTFLDNSTTDLYGEGGGLGLVGSNATLSNTLFSGNSAYYGGGMHSVSGSPSLDKARFTGNSASSGGGMYLGGYNNRVLTNVVISGNWAAEGGGMYIQGSGLTLANVTISGNYGNSGGGIYNQSNGLTLRNSIVWNNGAFFGGSQIYNASGMPGIAHCDVAGSGGSGAGWDGSLGTDLGGNLDADPLFWFPVYPGYAPTAAGILRLRWGSPAIDAGDNSLIPAGVTTDLAGKPRIYDGVVDMGAYETYPSDYGYLPLIFK